MTGSTLTPYDSSEEPAARPPLASERSRTVALVLGVIGGYFGFHRFYAGRPKSGALMALTLGGLGMWWLYDLVVLVAGEFRDSDGRLIRNWNVAETVGVAGGDARAVSLLMEQMDQLQQQVGELAERLDFTERLLTQQRERERLGKGT